MKQITMQPEGDSALRIALGNEISEEVNIRVHALAAAITEAHLPGVTELVPSYCSLLVMYDPRCTDYSGLKKQLAHLVKNISASRQHTGRVLVVPCCYDGEDLMDVAQLASLTPEEVIVIHSNPVYRIYMLGFLPGFVYLGGLDERIHAPRLSSPRKAIPAGSVGIGGNQTGIYPMTSPGGWRLIGRTPLTMYNPMRQPSVLVNAGDFIRFEPISAESYEQLLSDYASGKSFPRYEEVNL